MAKDVLRMCCLCRKMLPKTELVRLVNTNGNLLVDTTKKMQCRGYYICKSQDCINKLSNIKLINKIFKFNVSTEQASQLIQNITENI